jgi:hypothetical protein
VDRGGVTVTVTVTVTVKLRLAVSGAAGGTPVAPTRGMQSHSFDRGVPRDHVHGRASESPVEPYADRPVPEDVQHVYAHPEKVGHPDGVPHDIVGRTAIGLVIVAGVGVFAYLAFGAIVAVLAGIAALWLVWRGLPKKARAERTHEAIVEAHTPHPPARVTDDRRGDDNA